MRSVFLATALLVATPMISQAACTQAEARAKMDTLNGLMQPGRHTPAEPDRIMAGVIEVMRPGTVTEQTCVQLDALIAQARR